MTTISILYDCCVYSNHTFKPGQEQVNNKKSQYFLSRRSGF
jgi:hypothetical protein